VQLDYDKSMHHIQAKILSKLLYAQSSNYAGLRPEGVESNHFAYHLEQLLKEGAIVKEGKQYMLSIKGLRLVDQMSQEKMVAREQPHIVTAIDLTTPDGKTLLFKRNFQPYFHLLGFPNGKIHLEETVEEAVQRELTEKTGLTGIKLKQRGMIYIDAKQNGETISKVLYHIFHGEVKSELPTETPAHRGSCIWADPAQYKAEELMPGLMHVKDLLATHKGLFFDEIVVQL
jgi:ADP-ribose pyrophosphatase YjhB (NUDIX family)